MQVTYDPTPVTTAYGTAVTLLTALGTRTYTNRFGTQLTTQVVLPAAGVAATPNLLYLNSALPVDPSGLTFGLTAPIQLPGHGPNSLFTSLNVYNFSGLVAEGSSQRVDGLAQAFLSSVPGFLNSTIGASNINTLAVQYSACRAPLSFTNGLRAPTQPSAANGALRLSYSYYVSDGATYSVTANLSLTTSSAFATSVDQLGNPYQSILSVSGTRTYLHFPSGQTVVSTITGLSLYFNPNADQRIYPYTLLAASPGVYTPSTAPYLDSNGIGYSVSPSIPVNGAAPGSGVQYNSSSVYMYSTEATVVLVDGAYTSPPIDRYQQQLYTLLP